MKEIHISGNIYAEKDKYEKCGYTYVIRPRNRMGWELPTRDLTPEDLRKLADHLEASLSNNVKSEETSDGQ